VGEFADRVEHIQFFLLELRDARRGSTIAKEFRRAFEQPLFPDSGLRRMNLYFPPLSRQLTGDK
jgi:hypothetical protein